MVWKSCNSCDGGKNGFDVVLEGGLWIGTNGFVLPENALFCIFFILINSG